MFPTTAWSTIARAGRQDAAALESFARRYRPALLEFVRTRGLPAADAEDLVQDVLLRVIGGGVLERADPGRGRLRSLLLSITRNALVDRLRAGGRRITAVALEDEIAEPRDPEFDRAWILHLAELALEHLRESGSPYFDVLQQHVNGVPQNRNRLWLARRKLIARIRHEVALTCRSPEEFEDEVALLSPFLRPQNFSNPDETPEPEDRT